MATATAVLEELQERLGYRFRDQDLLVRALTHRSYAREQGEDGDNERLEFLGDAVLGLCIAHMLYEGSPRDPEGELSKKRAVCVNERCLADVARVLMIGPAMRLGKGEELSGGRAKASLLANALE
ncbi:MAG: ribonuclease III, partial [Syntrophales bacterium]|nr:ribonuclease III [Syntrophales bacterium]